MERTAPELPPAFHANAWEVVSNRSALPPHPVHSFLTRLRYIMDGRDSGYLKWPNSLCAMPSTHAVMLQSSSRPARKTSLCHGRLLNRHSCPDGAVPGGNPYVIPGSPIPNPLMRWPERWKIGQFRVKLELLCCSLLRPLTTNH